MKKTSRRIAGWALVLCVGFFTSQIQAAPLVSDSFDYTGPVTNNGWSAYSGADGSIAADGSVAQVGSGAEDIRLPFTDQLTGPTYASFVINIATLPASGSEYTFGFVDGTTMESRFGILSVGGTSYRLAAYAAGSTILATNVAELALNSDYTVTIYFDGVDDHRLWIDANSGDFSAPSIQVSGANSGIDGFFIRQAGALDAGASSWSMDDLSIATTFEEVLGGSPAITTNVKFTASSASAGEDAGTFVVTVVKTLAEGDVSGEISLGGTATEGGGNDYTIDTTNFVLNGATTSATFTVTINDDGEEEVSETVILGIENVVGGTVVAPNQFTLTITDNDSTLPTGIMFSQYTETDVGTSPKGVEVWNATGADITFDDTVNKLEIKVGSNGGTPNSAAIVTNGTLLDGDVLVIGTSDMTPDVLEGFTYNGDDAIVLEFGGFVVDVIGTVGVDPGSEWSGSGVSTLNQNIQLKSGIFTNDPDGWSDPSERFEFVAAGSVLTGFGVAPGGAPPTNVFFIGSADIAGEASGTYIVTVTKSLDVGDISGEVELGGTATEGALNDYMIDTTNFTMNGATTTATFTVTINDDVETELSETVTLTLANVVGGTVASPSVFTLTITDNDAVPEGIAAYRFTAAPFLEVTTKDANITVSDIALSTGSIETDQVTGDYFPNEPYISETGGWATNEQAGAKNFNFIVTPAGGYQVSITGISFRAYATGTGPSAIGYDINAGAATFSMDMTNDAIQVISNAVTGVDDVTTPITVMIQGWTNGTRVSSGGGTFRIDDIILFGVVELVGGGGDTTLDEYDVDVIAQSGGNFSITISASSNGVPYTLIYTTNILTDPAPAGTGTADTENGNGSTLQLQDASPADPSRLYWIRSNN